MKALRTILTVIALLAFTHKGVSQLNPQGIAPGLNLPGSEFNTHNFDLPVKATDLKIEDESGIHMGLPLRVAVSVPVYKDFFTLGKWISLSTGGRYYRVQLSSENAKALSVAFDHFYIPEHAQLFFYSPGKDFVFGGYTHVDNTPSGSFPSPVIEDDTVIVEYFEPDPGKVKSEPVLHIMELAHFYRPVNEGTKNGQIGSSWPCHVNINCSEGDDWQDVKRGVVRILLKVGEGYGWCSGSLINNTAQDGTPYIITAEHCGGIASAEDRNFWQFRFNFERPGCENQGLPVSQSIPGATLKAMAALENGSDLQLLELNFLPPPSFQPYYNGWDRSVAAPLYGVGIHHPNGDVKKISTFTEPAWTVNYAVISGLQMAYRSVWNLLYMATENGHGVLQPGSSGSSLFNQDKLIVGTASGGNTSCTNTSGNNLYGKFNFHWESNGLFASQQLKPWLDPLGTGQLTLQGIDLYPAPSVNNLSAELNQDFSVTLTWDYPAFESAQENWFSHISNYTSTRLEGPQRASKFNFNQQLEADTFYILKVAHLFWEHPNFLWGANNTFRFVIYGNDGVTVLHESPQILANNFQLTNTPVIYELNTPIAVTSDFYVAILPSATGNPSSLALEVHNVPNSFFGEPDAWQLYQANMKYYELLINVFGSTTAPNTDETGQEPGVKTTLAEKQPIRLGADFELFKKDNQRVRVKSEFNQKIMNNVLYYRVYRDNELIVQTESAEVFSFTDLDELQQDETYTYYLTAMYDINPANPFSPDHESAPSKEVSVKISFEDDNTSATLQINDQLMVFPNPSSGSFRLVSTTYDLQGQLKIVDLTGRPVKTVNLTNTREVVIDISAEPRGVYLLKIISGENTIIRRLLKF